MAVELIIADDDALVRGLADEILRQAGFTTLAIEDGSQALDAVRKHRPRALLLDILMPGIDGLSVCKALKSDPTTRGVKIIIVSGKSFAAEKERAQRYGADLFVEKPYDLDTFADVVIGVVGRPAGPAPAPSEAALARTALTVTVWGCRGGAEGGGGAEGAHTPCLTVETPDHLFIFDAGSGIVSLGRQLLTEARRELWILLTHFHPGHIQGLGLFPPTRAPGFTLRIGGPNDPDKTLEACVRECLEGSFTTDPTPVQASLQLYEFQAGDYDLTPGVKLKTFYANHPTTTLGYRLQVRGRSIVYCPDSEVYGEGATALQDYDELLGELCRGADLLVHDARWNMEDYRTQANQGHSGLLNAVDLAARHGVERLLLFHMDGAYDDARLDSMQAAAQEALRQRGSQLDCRLARAGLTITL